MGFDAGQPGLDNRPVGLYERYGEAPPLDLTWGPIYICPLHCKLAAEAVAAKHGAKIRASIVEPPGGATPGTGVAVCQHGTVIYLLPDEDWLFHLRHGDGL